MARMISFVVLVAILMVIGALFYQVMASFILPLFLAALLVVIFRPLHRWILVRCKNRTRVAAALTTAAILLIVLVPLGWVTALAAVEGINALTRFDSKSFMVRVELFRNRLGLQMPHADKLNAVQSQLDRLVAAASSTQPQANPEQGIAKLLSLVDDLESSLRSDAELKPGHGDVTHYEPAVASAAVNDLALVRVPLDWVRQSKLTPGDLDYLPLLQQAQLSYLSFRQALLGGPIMAWLKDQANPTEERLRNLKTQLTQRIVQWMLPALTVAPALVGQFVLGVVIMTLALYFFLVDGPAMVTAVMKLSPLDEVYERQLLQEFDTVSRAVVVAMLLSAVVQALLAGIGFYLTGAQSVFLLMLLTGCLSMVPFVGAAAVWLPVSLWMFFIQDRYWAGLFLFVYGTGVISLADNVVKPLVLHGRSNMHPLLALLSVLGGVQALGPIGILVGPMVVAFLHALLNMLQRELIHFSTDRSGTPALDTPASDGVTS